MRKLLIGACLLLLASGCRNEGSGSSGRPAGEAGGRLEQLLGEESAALARRDELSREREKVAADRAALIEKRRQVQAAGGDLAVVEKEERSLAERELHLREQEGQLDRKLDTLVRQYQGLASGAQSEEAAARRETQVAARERDFARREESLARRETELAARERDLAKREKETCGAGTVTTIVQAAPAPGAKYTRRDIEPLLASARRKMAEKGVLPDDLPATARGLERESTEAVSDGDFGKAKLAADQLLASVDSLRIDRAFVAAKIGRLNAAVRSRQLGAAERETADELFRGATADYGDGKFTSANAKLNRIYAELR